MYLLRASVNRKGSFDAPLCMAKKNYTAIKEMINSANSIARVTSVSSFFTVNDLKEISDLFYN